MDAKMTIIVILSFRIRLQRTKMRKLSLFRPGLACVPTNTKLVEEVEYLLSVNSLFSSEIAELNSTKLDRKQDLKVLYQDCVSRTYRKNKIAAAAFIKFALIFVGNQKSGHVSCSNVFLGLSEFVQTSNVSSNIL